MLPRYTRIALLGAIFLPACSPENDATLDVDGSSGRNDADATFEGGAPPSIDASIVDVSSDAPWFDAKRDAGATTDERVGDVVGDSATRDGSAIDASRDVATNDGSIDSTTRDAAVDSAVGRDGGGTSTPPVALDATLRFKRINLRPAGSSKCATVSASGVTLADCGGTGQDLRAEMLGPGYVAFVDDATGDCVTAAGAALGLAACTNSSAQQFSATGSAAGYQLVSLSSSLAIGADLRLGATPAKFEIRIQGNADPLAVVVDERPIGSATMPAKIVVPGTTLPTGNEKTRDAPPTTGGGTWEAARAKTFSNVTWFKPADFAGSAREAAIANVANALKATGPSVVLFEEGTYDFSLTTPKTTNRCNGTCSAGGTYTEIGGFCPDDATCASTAGCVVGGYQDPYRTLDVGSDKTILGLGGGAVFRRLGLRFIGQHNVIYRNVAHREMPGSVRAWDDGLLFWPADHVWLDHMSFSGFGRGAVVLSGTRIPNGSSFYAWPDSGWMTFSWIVVDSTESWRCGNKEDSPYPFFTTEDPSLTFHHALFLAGHGRNPALDGQSAHLFNCAWSNVSDGLNGRNGAELLVEGSWFDGDRPIRVEEPVPPIVLAPIDAKAPGLGDPRRLNLLSARADASLRADFKGRGIDVNTLNTNSVATPTYPYSLDLDPSQTLQVVTDGAGAGKGGFPMCTVNAGTKTYVCK